MRYLLYIACLLSLGFIQPVVIIQTPSSGVSCIGYPEDGTDCSPTFDGITSLTTSDSTFTRQWVATTDGTAKRIHMYFGEDIGYINIDVILYVDSTIKALGTITPVAETWVWSGTLVAESGQSLDFSTDDELYFGITVDTSSAYRSAQSASYSNRYYQSGYKPTSTWTSSSYDFATVLEYE